MPRQDRIYWLELRVSGKKRKERLGPIGFELAAEIEIQRKREIREGHYRAKRDMLVWKMVSEAFLRKLEAEEASSQYIADSRRYLKEMGAAWGDERPVQEITPVMIRDFLTRLRGRKLKETTVNRYLAAGKAAWNHRCENVINPFERVQSYNEREHIVTPELTPDERERFFRAAQRVSDQFYRMVIVWFGTGLRKSNVLNLRRSEVDFQAKLIRLTQKRNRPLTIPLRPDVETALAGIPDDGSGYFFVNPRTGEPYTKWWRNAWTTAIQSAGINRRFTFHGARHDFGMRAYAATEDILAVSRLLGHSQVAMSQRYVRTLPEQLQKAADKIDMPSVNLSPNTSPTEK